MRICSSPSKSTPGAALHSVSAVPLQEQPAEKRRRREPTAVRSNKRGEGGHLAANLCTACWSTAHGVPWHAAYTGP